MPIRINLLAEAKAAEELRRHDPVKRVIFFGAFLVALALVWSSSLQLERMLGKKAVTDRQTPVRHGFLAEHAFELERTAPDQRQRHPETRRKKSRA